MIRRNLLPIAQACCFLFLIAVLPNRALAHATPILYDPAASSVLSKAPAEIQIHFSERLEPRVSGITVIGPDGTRVDLGNSAPASADPRIYSVGLKDAGPGTYTVSWEVISSDDGHFTKGAYVFSVGKQSPSAATDSGGFQTVHSSSVPEALTLAIELIGDALILGALIVLAWIWRPARKYFPEVAAEDRQFARRFQILFITGCLLALAGGVAYLVYKTGELASLQEIAFAQAWSPFLATTSALYTIGRMLGAGFMLAAFLPSRKRVLEAERVTRIEYTMFAVLAFIDFARARVSHAAASTFAPAFGVLMNFVHLLFKDAWIGGIIALMFLCSGPIRRARSTRLAAFALTAFSRVASVALGIAGVTGVYVVWLHLKDFSFVLTTDWGKRFAILSVFAAFLLISRFFSQLYCEPKIVEAVQKREQAQLPRIFHLLKFTLPAEAIFGVAILAVTSLLIITTPPLAPHFSFVRTATSQGITLTLTEQPSETGRFLLTAVGPANQSVANVKNVTVTLTNPAAGIGPIIAPIQQRFADGFVFDEKLLAPAGDWTMDVTAQRAGAYDAVATFRINYPREIMESDAHAEDRSFGSFERIHIIAALLIVVVSILLYRKSSQSNLRMISVSESFPAKGEICISGRGAWILPVAIVAGVLYLGGGFPAVSPGILESPFQRSCEETNVMNVWHESVPERDGRATSDLALPGCTVGIGLGQYHFVDAREFAYFIRPARARAQLATNPPVLTPNTPVTLTFNLRDLQGNPVQDLILDHNRIAHVVIASRDFSVFAHIHAEDSSPITPEMLQAATFPVRYTFPKPGQYLISVDYAERGYIFSDQFYLNVGDPSPMGPPSKETFSRQEKVDGYDVTLKTSPATLRAGVPATLDYHIERDGKQVTNLEPYLAVPMHISIIRDDLMAFLHIHGLLPVSFSGKLLGESIHASHLLLPNHFGPDIEATSFAFPASGTFHIFGEFSAGGKVVVTQFTVRVE